VVPLDAGSSLIIAAIAVTVTGAPAMLAVRKLRARPATGLMTAALAVTFGWLVAAAVAVAPSDHPPTHGAAVLGSAAVTCAAALALAAAERLPGVVQSAHARLRQRVDVVLIASALGTGGWIGTGLLFHHATPMRVQLTWSAAVIAPPVLASIGTLAHALVVIARAGPPRLAVSLLSVGSFLATAGGTVLVTELALDRPAHVASESLAVATGLALIGVATAAPLREHLSAARATHNRRWFFAGVVVIAALVLVLVQLSYSGVLHHLGIIAAVVCASTLVLRQWIALWDAHKLALRLAEDDEHLRKLAYTDALTGVANRRELLRVLDDEARGGPPCTLLAIDLDGFKNVNDMRGHDVGDMVLAEIGRRLRSNLRPGDVAARLGGDEFAVLMWAGLPEATAVAKRLLTMLSEPHATLSGPVFVSASIGVAGCAAANDVQSLLRNADLALRFAKQRGKDRFELYDVAYDQWLRRRTAVEHELRGAVTRDELDLAYQPVVDLETRRIVGVEALLRWEHPRLGTVPPDEFIPIAEDAGMIGELDQWVLHRACRQLSRWLGDGHDIWLSVNISVRELHLFDYVAHIEEVLRAHRVPADHLVLEVTEHTVAVDLDELVEQLRALRAAGVRIALDDFGAGYSSLGQLRTLPVDILKIDRSLVGDPGRTPEAVAGESNAAPAAGASPRDAGKSPTVHAKAGSPPLVDVVVTLGQRLGLTVIAEGVAKPDELAVVRAAGARLIQGEMFGRAMPAERVEAMLVSAPTIPTQLSAQDMGQLDSGREMRQS
jgi:diguanylate cyclase